VLAAVKARPLGVRASGMRCVPAGLDGVCARRPRRSAVGAGEVCGASNRESGRKEGAVPQGLSPGGGAQVGGRRDRAGAHPHRARARLLGGVNGTLNLTRVISLPATWN
jgi:hypothetical protein